jgi:hypothetical protein
VIMYICVRDVKFAYFDDVSIGVCK